MRAWFLLLLCSCGTWIEGTELGLDDPAWHVTFDTSHGDWRTSLGCKGAGMAKRRVDGLAAGRWHLRIEHSNSECRSAARAVVLTPGGTWLDRLGEAPLRAGPKGGTADVAFTLRHDGAVEVAIAAVGGLDCWGETTIRGVWLERQ
jgi:hypothetical protein